MLPTEYQWLTTIGLLPRVIQEALPLIGTQEVVGKGSNKTIIRWRDELNQAGVKISGFSDDDVPWCGLFVAYVCMKAGKPVVTNPLWARNWIGYGTPVLTTDRRGRMVFEKGMRGPCLGDVMVYSRPGGGGHVEFYIGETKRAYVGIGGNKNNAVRIGGLLKSRCIYVGRPKMTTPPRSVRPWELSSAGTLTSNEA